MGNESMSETGMYQLKCGTPDYFYGSSTVITYICGIHVDSSNDDNEYEIWNEAEDEEEQNNLHMEVDVDSTSGTFLTLSRWLVHFTIVMQAVFRLSDVVVNSFLAFFKVFFSILGRSCPSGSDIANHLPSSLYAARKMYGEVEFQRYVVCRRCHKIYFFESCIEGCTTKRSKLCCYSHPYASMRRPCGTLLLKTVEIASGKKFFYPFLTYCYIGLEASIQALVNRSSFLINCEKWRQRSKDTGVLSDVYDGEIWKEFMEYKGDPFLSKENNFALTLNMDFFQPYKHVQYSLGAIYP